MHGRWRAAKAGETASSCSSEPVQSRSTCAEADAVLILLRCAALRCVCRDLSVNGLNSTLPPDWGVGFPFLRLLNVSNNQLVGGFPEQYKGVDSFPLLRGL